MADMSLLAFMGHISKFEARLHDMQAKGFKRIGEIVEREAKREIGTYQAGNNGPFADWAELADATKADRLAKGFTENDPGLRAGDMRASIDHVSDRTGAVIGSNDDKLVWFELGTDKQPPRSVLGVAVIHTAPALAHIGGAAVTGALIGRDVFQQRMPIAIP